MVVTLSSVTVLETKMNQKTKSSVGAFYNSESGVEWALNQIAAKSGSDKVNTIAGWDRVNHYAVCPFGGDTCKVYFIDKTTNNIITDGVNTDISQIAAVRSVGTQNTGDTTQRAIEAAVAAAPCWCSPSDMKITSATHDGNFGGYQGMYNWIQSNGCSGYHVCDTTEVTRYWQTHSATGFSTNAWINTGMHALLIALPTRTYVNDCGDWSLNGASGGSANAAITWDNRGFVGWDNCSTSNAVLCCK